MLTVAQIQVLKAAARPFKVFDSEGLYLLAHPSGALSDASAIAAATSSGSSRSAASPSDVVEGPSEA